MTEVQQEGRILLVDDNEPLRRVYAKVLTKIGFTVVTAGDGQEATELLQGSAFDVVVSDLSMPRMGGLEFLRTLREHDLDMPVVLMTGVPSFESAVAAVEYGAFRYLSKPVDLDQFTDVVRRAVSMRQLARLKREAMAVLGAEGHSPGDHATLDARFTGALEQLWMAYQPIVNTPRRTVFAYEALLRSTEPSLRGPLELLDAAERLGRLNELGRTIRAQVARDAPQAPPDTYLFVNLHAADLNDPELLSPSSPLTAIAARVVLEITERASLHAVTQLGSKVEQLRRLGFQIAIDDLGAGYAGLTSFTQLEPEFVKLDMSLVRGLDTSPRKRSVVQAMLRLCTQELGIQVVSEGVETPAERDALEADGCALLQGYLFAKPERGFPVPRW